MMNFIRSLIYALKRILHAHPRLYAAVFAVLTLNSDRIRRMLDRDLYPSAFGGMWTDREDFQTLLQRKLARGVVQPVQVDLLTSWREKGFAVLDGAISSAQIDALVGELDNLPQQHPPGLQITGGGELDSRTYRPELVRPHESIRIVDFYFFSEAARTALFNPTIVEALRTFFEAEPVLTQSLSFEYGSEQQVHQDTAFVIMNSPLKFAASWIALEDVKEGSGELIYYPGSHRWRDYLFSGRFRHWDRERDGNEQLAAWHAWLHEEAKRQGVELEVFRPKKGDVLLWHGGLAHGGAPIRHPGMTRRSLVGHYCANGVRPLYHYYKPAHRKIYSDSGRRFSTSYYLPEQRPR